jgi:hypothetical protein
VYNTDTGFLLLLGLIVACVLSIWLTVLFLRLCRDVKSIKVILMTAYGLEEFRKYGGHGYRRKETMIPEEQPARSPDFLK